ncbi:MAG: DnaA regulatory inactivator Hda [Chromatiales bacterium]|nr:DnaA regulatory inactivator Hda [Chromatiales bacterium]
MSLSKQLLLRFGPQKNKVFDNFLPTNNKTVVDHLHHLCQSNLGVSYQTYLWGPPSSGKSHLLQATCSAITHRSKRSIYLPLQLVGDKVSSILNGLESVDLVCIDEAEFIAESKIDIEGPLFNLINRVRDENGCLLVAGRSNPRQLALRLSDLKSRLLWGSVHKLTAITDEHKPAALALHAKLNGTEIPAVAITYLLNHYPRDMDSLIKVVNHISRVGFQCKHRLTIPFVKRVLAEMPRV